MLGTGLKFAGRVRRASTGRGFWSEDLEEMKPPHADQDEECSWQREPPGGPDELPGGLEVAAGRAQLGE